MEELADPEHAQAEGEGKIGASGTRSVSRVPLAGIGETSAAVAILE